MGEDGKIDGAVTMSDVWRDGLPVSWSVYELTLSVDMVGMRSATMSGEANTER